MKYFLKSLNFWDYFPVTEKRNEPTAPQYIGAPRGRKMPREATSRPRVPMHNAGADRLVVALKGL